MILRLLLIHHSLQLIRTPAKQHDRDRGEENLEIKDHRLVLNVVAIKQHDFLEAATARA